MKQGKCYGCERKSNNLLTANCGHKTCFHCVRKNRTSKRCSQCSGSTHSPSKMYPVESASLEKSKMKSQQLTSAKAGEHSPIQLTTRKTMITIEDRQQTQHTQAVYCREHGEPFSMYCQKSKEIICAVCLYKKGKVSSILPLKNAEEVLKRQNKQCKQQARLALGQIQSAHKVCKNNRTTFQKYLKVNMQILNETFNLSHRELDNLKQKYQKQVLEIFNGKIDQYLQICNDLQYLTSTLTQYRNNNRESNTLNESIFVFQSYKIIKQTLKTLDLDYISYLEKSPIIIQIDQRHLDSCFKNFIQINDKLPLKIQSKSRRMSCYEIEKYSIVEEDLRKIRAKSRYNRRNNGSLCNNQMQNDNDAGLYKRILKSKFKAN